MIFEIENENLKVRINSFGAAILSMDYFAKGLWNHTTLEYDSIDTYKEDPYYLNAVVGPHAGRVKQGIYQDGDQTIQLEVNNNGNHLHGGSHSFSSIDFKGLVNETKTQLNLEGYSDEYKCNIELRYRLDKDSLIIDYKVVPSEDLLINMTQHTYFNLSGEKDIRNHQLKIDGTQVCFLDDNSVPSKLVERTGPFDFKEFKRIGDMMDLNHEQFEISYNIDHPFKIDHGSVFLESDVSGIGVEISSSEVYAIIYLANFFLGETSFKDKGLSQRHEGIAIEAQALPNDVNLNLGKNQITRAGDTYKHQIKYRFYTK